jgi:hypothetical protein
VTHTLTSRLTCQLKATPSQSPQPPHPHPHSTTLPYPHPNSTRRLPCQHSTRRDGRALPLLRRGGVRPRHPPWGVPGRGAPSDTRHARRAPGPLLLRRARRAPRRERWLPYRLHGRCVRVLLSGRPAPLARGLFFSFFPVCLLVVVKPSRCGLGRLFENARY